MTSRLLRSWATAVIAGAVCALPPAKAFGAAPTDDQPSPNSLIGRIVRLDIRGAGEAAGVLLGYDETHIRIEQSGKAYAVPWDNLTTASAYLLKKQILAVRRGGEERLTADDHVELGVFALTRGHSYLAERELTQAVRMEPGLRPSVERRLSEFRRKRDAAQPDLLTPPSSAPRDPTVAGRPAFKAGANIDAVERARIIEDHKAQAVDISRRLEARLSLIETEHFLIWTDWRKTDQAMLATWLERTYDVLCQQFDFPAKVDVFAGKCPVYCFAGLPRFSRFAKLFDDHEIKGTLGYTRIQTDGHVHMALYLRGREPADLQTFATTMVHECAHAFLHRYRSHRLLVGWLSEGLANLIAERVLGDYCRTGEEAAGMARQYVRDGRSISEVFAADQNMPSYLYPICHSLVEFLASRDRDAFVELINDVKDGIATEQALRRRYDGMTYPSLEAEWRKTWAASPGDERDAPR